LIFKAGFMSTPRTVIVIQARMGSGRLPGKVLRPVCGKPMLLHVVERMLQCRAANQVAVATSTHPMDELIAEWARSAGVFVYQGSEEDVVERFYGVTRALQADAVVRITADCPLIDPEVTDRVIRAFHETRPAPDYGANVLERTLPRGLDTDVFSRSLIERLSEEAAPGPEREHLDLHVLHHPGKFSALSVRATIDHSGKRWTVDTAADLAFVRQVYDALYPTCGCFGWRDIFSFLARRPELEALNQNVPQRYDDPAPQPAQWKNWRSVTMEE
jgi:spore coat polysaccharide biosynthesis protein SpsF